MSVFVLVTAGKEPVCDFCGSLYIVIGYLIKDFTLPQYQWGSVGGFAACADCMKLVETGQRAALEKRAHDSFIEAYGRSIPSELIQIFIHDLHTEFWNQIERRMGDVNQVSQKTVH